MRLRVGSVPYLNAKPLVDWFHSPDCNEDVEVVYAVPSELARMVRAGEVDVCNCSIFESLSQPGLCLVPDISISSDGPVKSVRLFAKKPAANLKSVALDTSSLTSAALAKVILSELYGCDPLYISHAPDLDQMLSACDAGLIIGDLKLFALHADTQVYDLGECWQRLTCLPFVYAAWQAPLAVQLKHPELPNILSRARDWGVARLDKLAKRWAVEMHLPYERCLDYFTNAMDYDLGDRQLAGMNLYQDKCTNHGLIPTPPVRVPMFGGEDSPKY